MTCQNLVYEQVKAPDSEKVGERKNIELPECQAECDQKPECKAFVYDSYDRLCQQYKLTVSQLFNYARMKGGPKGCAWNTDDCVSQF